MPLLDLVEQFQQLMNQVVDLAEETKAEVQQLPEVGMREASAKINTIFDLCDHGSTNFKKASELAEEIKRTLG